MPAKKETKDKPDLSHIPYCAESELAKAMQYGTKKYGRYNYCKGHDLTQLVAAAKRHLGKYLEGEDCDNESGVHHLGHVMANCLMLLHQGELGTLRDDRYQPGVTETRLPDGTTMVWEAPAAVVNTECRLEIRDESKNNT